MPLDKFGYQRDALLGRHVWKANQAGMLNIVQINEFTEVRVDRDEDSVLDIRAFR